MSTTQTTGPGRPSLKYACVVADEDSSVVTAPGGFGAWRLTNTWHPAGRSDFGVVCRMGSAAHHDAPRPAPVSAVGTVPQDEREVAGLDVPLVEADSPLIPELFDWTRDRLAGNEATPTCPR